MISNIQCNVKMFDDAIDNSGTNQTPSNSFFEYELEASETDQILN